MKTSARPSYNLHATTTGPVRPWARGGGACAMRMFGEWNVDLSIRDSRAPGRNGRENRVVTAADSRDRRVFGGPLQNDQPAHNKDLTRNNEK